MSDELNTGAAPAVDTSAASPSIDAPADSSPAPDTGASHPDYDSIFGLEPETPDEKAPDVPAAHPGTESVETGDEPAEPAPEQKPVAEAKPDEAEKKPGEYQPNEKINWDDDKVPFREEFKNLKAAYLSLLENSPEAQYLNSPQEFAKWMKEISPTSFAQVGGLLATESAQTHPKEWLEYFVDNHPDMMAEMLSGREGMTAERLKAELSVILDDDDPDVQAALDKGKTEPAPEETPEQKEIREWREQREQEARQHVAREVFAPIERAVNGLISEAGLDIDLTAYEGKNFAELDADTQFKVLVNEMIPQWIDYRVKQDPKMVNMQARLQEFLDKKDVQSARQLQHPATIAATNFAGELIELLTGKRVQAKRAETQIPAKEPPKPVVKGTGAAAPAIDLTKPLTAEDWSGRM